MNRWLIYAILVIVACGCSRSQIVVEGRIIGSDASKVYIERVGAKYSTFVDSVRLDDKGYFKVSFEDVVSELQLYNLVCDVERIPLFLRSGDRVQLNSIGNLSLGYRVEGSEESELLRQFFQPYYKGLITLERIANKYASPSLSDDEYKVLSREYGTEFQEIKRAQLRFIIENQTSMAAVYALLQRLPGDEYLFNESSDMIYFRTVADAIETLYPSSTYLKSLRNQISAMESSVTLKASMANVDYPDIKMSDMYGTTKSLSSLMGRVILLNFWSPESRNSNVQNAELKEIYYKYRDLGLEVYQVGVTSSKPIWISAVQEQRLPWISVSDMRGASSPALGVYNVTTLPDTFLIDRTGEIVARDVAIDDTLEAKIERLLR